MLRVIIAGLLTCSFLAPAQSRFVQAELTTPIKTKKAKVGDPVKARTISEVKLPNDITVPAGSVLLGELRSLDPDSVSISFDAFQNGSKTTPLKLNIRAAMMPVQGKDGTREAQRAEATTGAVIGLDGVSIKVDESGHEPTKFQSSKGELKLDKGLQLMLGVVE
ncbi:MAG TPA: hypothetical protein VKT81_11415 [Bryobacteraceae bacterium]|nr:hypothetical protein [Bryobacteraceae bacterium]